MSNIIMKNHDIKKLNAKMTLPQVFSVFRGARYRVCS